MRAPPNTHLVASLGTGASFEVALVAREGGGAPLVCKRLLPSVSDERAARAALVREARILAALKHPALPQLHEVGQDASGPFLLEERVEGRSFRELARGWSPGPVPADLSLHLTKQAFCALRDIHAEQGLSFVHGDITPDHVWMGPCGEVRFVDFGASRLATTETSLLGEDRGTLPFVAPEIAREEAIPTQAADVYGLAASALYLLLGDRIVDSRTDATWLVEVASVGLRVERLSEIQGLSLALREVLSAALAFSPAERLSGASEICARFA